MATLGTQLYTFLKGRLVGEDPFGNKYYTERRAPKNRRAKRWTVYKGLAEPSKVPAEWHGWLHYTLEAPIPPTQAKRHAWQKEHRPNLTGTTQAYLPPGHLLRGGRCAPSTSDYEPWKPN